MATVAAGALWLVFLYRLSVPKGEPPRDRDFFTRLRAFPSEGCTFLHLIHRSGAIRCWKADALRLRDLEALVERVATLPAFARACADLHALEGCAPRLAATRLGPRFDPRANAIRAFVAVWRLGWVNPVLMPPPSLVFLSMVRYLGPGGDYLLWKHIVLSLYRLLAGFAIAAVIAIPFGTAVGLFRPVYRFFTPILSIILPIPSIAWVPIGILWLGLGNATPIFIVFITAIFPIIRDLMRIHQETHKTIVFVTHSVQEAILLGDRIFVLSARPSTIKEALAVQLPWPRSFNDPEFVALQERNMETLSGEVERTMRAERG